MQRKEGTAGHIENTHKVSDAEVRAAGPNPPMYRRPHRGLLPRQSRGHGPLGEGRRASRSCVRLGSRRALRWNLAFLLGISSADTRDKPISVSLARRPSRGPAPF